MPRRSGVFGAYGLRGHSTLALRRRREAENPGFRVCRKCDALIPESELVQYVLSPRCRPCASAESKKYAAKRPTGNGIHKRNRALAESGLKHCTTCGEDKPLDNFYSHGSKCRPCKDAQVHACQKRKVARSGRGASYSWHTAAQARIRRESVSLERRLSYCVNSVFKRLAKVCPKCGVDKPGDMYGISRRGVGIILAKHCKSCKAKQQRDRMHADPVRARELRRRHRQNRQKDPAWRKRMHAKRHRRLMARVAAGDPAAIRRREASQASALRAATKSRALFPELVKEKVYRSVVFKRDGGCCAYCGVTLSNAPGAWHMDHVFSLSRGGEHSYGNVVASCIQCNSDKGNKMLLNFLWEREQRQQVAA